MPVRGIPSVPTHMVAWCAQKAGGGKSSARIRIRRAARRHRLQEFQYARQNALKTHGALTDPILWHQHYPTAATTNAPSTSRDFRGIWTWIPTMPRSILRGGRYPNYLRWATYARSVVMKPVWFLPLFKFPNIYPPKHFTRGETGTPVTTNIVCDSCATVRISAKELSAVTVLMTMNTSVTESLQFLTIVMQSERQILFWITWFMNEDRHVICPASLFKK